jgi:hypothetical protein
MKTAAEEEAYGAVTMTANTCVQFQVCLSNTEIEATTWRIPDTDRVVNQLKREIVGITPKFQILFMKKFSIYLVEFEASRHQIGVQELQTTIERFVISFRYPKMHLVSHILETVW